MDIAICVLGSCGLTWSKWKALVETIEGLGYPALYCADHFTIPLGPELDSLEPWTSMTWAAGATKRIELGTLVSPFSFRDPVFMARVAKDIDALCDGRFTLGMGAGWMKREEQMFGYSPDATQRQRADRMEEGVQLVHALLCSDEPVTRQGKYYNVEDAVLLPRPIGPNSPRLMIGGNGEKRTLPLVAKYADEWNGNSATPSRFRELNQLLDALLDANGRKRDEVKRSATTNLLANAQQEALFASLIPGWEPEDGRRAGYVMGAQDEMLQQIEEYALAGAERLVLQVIEVSDPAYLEEFAKVISL